jgi:hypothetical protein
MEPERDALMEHPLPVSPLAVNGCRVGTAAEFRTEHDGWGKREKGVMAHLQGQNGAPRPGMIGHPSQHMAQQQPSMWSAPAMPTPGTVTAALNALGLSMTTNMPLKMLLLVRWVGLARVRKQKLMEEFCSPRPTGSPVQQHMSSLTMAGRSSPVHLVNGVMPGRNSPMHNTGSLMAEQKALKELLNQLIKKWEPAEEAAQRTS